MMSLLRPPALTILGLTLYLIVLLLWPAAVQAQEPAVQGLLPAGGQQGTVCTIVAQGSNLQAASALIGGIGITVQSVVPNAGGDSAAITLNIAKNAALGPHELRLWTPRGVSNPVRLWIDVFPERIEVEPNDDLAHAQNLDALPIVMNGRIQSATDRDVYSFQSNAGETWVFDCNAARLRSRLDPILELTDSGGHRIATAQSDWETDPRLVFRFTVTGRYYITVRDTQFLSGPDFPYRLTVGQLPLITSYMPHGERPGHYLKLAIQGINLGSLTALDVTVPPADYQGVSWVSPQLGTGKALPIPLVTDTLPVVPFGEGLYAPPVLEPPCVLDGVFGHTPHATVRVRVHKNQPLMFDLLGQRIGSRIDGALRIVNASGKELAVNDDAIGKDARLDFTPPEDGVYSVELRNVEGIVGPDCYYRLRVVPVVPDFRLTLNTEHIPLGIDGTTAVEVHVEGLEGWDAPITLTAESLPAGVSCSGGVISRGQSSVEITFTSSVGTAATSVPILIRGTGTMQGHIVTHEVIGRDTYLPRSIDPALFTDDSYRRPYRDWDLLPLGLMPRSEGFAVETDTQHLSLVRGKKIQIKVRVRRRPEAKGEIKLLVRGVPEKVTVDAPSIPADHNDGMVTLTVAADAPATVRNLILQGQLGPTVQTAPAITLVLP